MREDACGGTEQVAFQVLAGLATDPRYELAWIGAPGSQTFAGIAFHPWSGRAAALDLARTFRPDLIHNLGVLDWRIADDTATTVLFSVHLAHRLYPPGLFAGCPGNLHLQGVSRSQARDHGGRFDCGIIPNGIALGRYLELPRKGEAGEAPLLYLGRICPEKAADAAIAIARSSGRRLWIVGSVADFPSHREYFRQQIAPHLGEQVAWMPTPGVGGKLELLARAAAVIVPSRIEETSSLVAMEAAAAGVPVIARAIGALPEIVADGRTGWLGERDEELAAAVARLPEIAPEPCRRHAAAHFDGQRMVRQYGELYAQLQ